MQKFHCTNCSYVYNPFLWDEESEVESWTAFDELHDNWHCPVCSENKEFFVEIPENIHDFKKFEELLPEEIRHTPFYYEKDWKIIISIWTEDESFSQDEVHFIEYVGLFYNDWEIIDYIKLPENLDEIIFDLDNIDEYEVRASCSLHWVWRWVRFGMLN